jgi:hypothetical protein
MGWVVIPPPRPLCLWGRDPLPILEEAVLTPGPVWRGAENLASPPGFLVWTVQPVASGSVIWHCQNLIEVSYLSSFTLLISILWNSDFK